LTALPSGDTFINFQYAFPSVTAATFDQALGESSSLGADILATLGLLDPSFSAELFGTGFLSDIAPL
jgi:hypothetical protein